MPSPLDSGIFSLDLLSVIGHYKNGAYLSPHIHIAPSFLFSGSSSFPLRKREEENSAVGWIPLEDFPTITSESHMRAGLPENSGENKGVQRIIRESI